MYQVKPILLALCVTGVSVSAQAADKKVPEGWQSTAEAGVVVTNGNTKTSTVNAKFDTKTEDKQWRHNIHAESLSSSNTNVTSAEKYLLSGKSDYKFNEFDYAFGLIKFEKDRFSGFENQVTVAAGYGRRLLNDADQTLDLEIGPGVRFFEIDNDILPTAKRESEAVLLLAAKYALKLSDNAKLTEDLTSEIGSDLTTIKSVTGLQANINSSLALKVTLTIKNSSGDTIKPPVKETDTETAVTLVYSF